MGPGKGNRKGRRPDGAKKRIGINLFADRKVIEAFLREAAMIGSESPARAFEMALRYWLRHKRGLAKDDPAIVPPEIARGGAGPTIGVKLPKDWREALAIHAARTGRSVPAVGREAIARYVRARGHLEEFKDLEEWRLIQNLDDDPTS